METQPDCGEIMVIGSSNTDLIITLDHIPKPGETIAGDKLSRVLLREHN